jgi:hypothetical protein
MPRFLQSMLFLLSLSLFLLSIFLLIIRQQDPMQYSYLIYRQASSMRLTIWREDIQDVYVLAAPAGSIDASVSAVHPEGRWYAVRGSTPNGAQLYLGRLDSDYLIYLESPPVTVNPNVGQLFSPDGNWLLFSVAETSATRRLYIVPVKPRSDPYQLDAGVLSVFTRVFWMPDSEWIIYEIPSKNEIYRIHRSGGSPQLISTGELYSTQVFEEEWLLIEDSDALYLLKSDGMERLPVSVTADRRIEIFGTLHERRWLQLETYPDNRFPIPKARLRWQQLFLLGLLFSAVSLYPLRSRIVRLA